MKQSAYAYYLANEPVETNHDLLVTNKYDGRVAAHVAQADARAIDTAIAAAVEAAPAMRRVPAYLRQKILLHVVRRVEERHEELARTLAIEAGKPIRDARGEVTRLVDTFRIAAEEAVRQYGEWMPLDISSRAVGYEAVWRRFPVGPCGFITPFNFPMNLVAHKVAPAIAAGCTWVLKPASKTPVGALLLGEILAETELPKGSFSILPCSGSVGEAIATDERIALLSFTGSPEVGWALKTKAGRKKVSLELGGNAACIVDRDADIEYAAERITIGAFYQSGQSCISVQRVLAHREIYDRLKQRLVERAHALEMGDPLREETFLGPLISEDDAKRIETWVREAVADGARLLCGGRRKGAMFEATYLEDVNPRQKVSCVEVFGPLATLQPFERFDEAIRIANDSRYGLQAGVFTRDIEHAYSAYEELDVGGVVVNDVPSFRVDSMPYGGVKESGLGREGVRFAMEEMTDRKVMVLRRRGAP